MTASALDAPGPCSGGGEACELPAASGRRCGRRTRHSRRRSRTPSWVGLSVHPGQGSRPSQVSLARNAGKPDNGFSIARARTSATPSSGGSPMKPLREATAKGMAPAPGAVRGEACPRARPSVPGSRSTIRGVHSDPAGASRRRSSGPSLVQTFGRAALDPSGQGQGRYGIPPAFSGANAGKPNNRLSLPRRWAVGQWFAAPTVQIAYSDAPEIDRNPSTTPTTPPAPGPSLTRRQRSSCRHPRRCSICSAASSAASSTVIVKAGESHRACSRQHAVPADAPDPGPPKALDEALPHDPGPAQRFAPPHARDTSPSPSPLHRSSLSPSIPWLPTCPSHS